MNPAQIIGYLYKYANMIKKSASGRQLLQLGTSGLATSQVIDGIDDFFGPEGPGANVSTTDSKKMKEAVAWIIESVPEQFRGPWTIKGVEYDANYLTMKLNSDQIWMSHKHYSKKMLDNAYKRGMRHGENKARREMTQQNQIAKGVK